MPNLTLESAEDVIAGLKVRGHYVHCPFCDRPMMTSGNAEGSALWGHFFSKKHALERPVDPQMEDALAAFIRRTSKAAKRAERQAEIDAKQARAAARRAEELRLRATHSVSGAFLDEIVEEMEVLIQMMEPYYSQANGDRSARAKIAEIRAISGTPLED